MSSTPQARFSSLWSRRRHKFSHPAGMPARGTPRNARLIVAVLPKDDNERESRLRLSAAQLNAAYDGDVDEYPLDLVKEINPDYEGW